MASILLSRSKFPFETDTDTDEAQLNSVPSFCPRCLYFAGFWKGIIFGPLCRGKVGSSLPYHSYFNLVLYHSYFNLVREIERIRSMELDNCSIKCSKLVIILLVLVTSNITITLLPPVFGSIQMRSCMRQLQWYDWLVTHQH